MPAKIYCCLAVSEREESGNPLIFHRESSLNRDKFFIDSSGKNVYCWRDLRWEINGSEAMVKLSLLASLAKII